MRIFFAAVGSDLWECLENARKGKPTGVLFSYYDMDLGGFQFRRKSWERLTGLPFERILFDRAKEISINSK